MAFKAVLASVLTSAVLVGCGGSDSGSPSFSKFSASEFTKLANSSSISGTWVAVASGSSKSVYNDGFWEERDFSRKAFFVIKENNEQYSISSCNSGFNTVTYSSLENTIQLSFSNGYGYLLTVENNNYISGSMGDSDVDGDGDYNQYDYEYVKVSDSVAGLGEVSADWSGSSTSADTVDDIFALCLENISEVDSDGDTSQYLEAEIGIETYNRYVELRKGNYYGESEEYVFVSGDRDTVSESSYWGGNANVEYSQTASTFTATANATENSGESVSVVISAKLPAQ